MKIIYNSRKQGRIYCSNFCGCGSIFDYDKSDIRNFGDSTFIKDIEDSKVIFEQNYGVECPVCRLKFVLYRE